MAELATIARPYAEALFQVSRADLAATQSWLDSLARAAGNDELLQFAANPKVNASQVFHIVTSVLQGPLPERGANFLRAVIDNHRLAALPEVARQFRQLANSVSGSADALIQSAFPISLAENHAGKALWPPAGAERAGRSRSDWRRARGRGRRGARHLGQGPPGTNEDGPHRLMRQARAPR